MDEDVPIIYGIELQARCLTCQAGETEIIRFLIGTQSLRHENQVQLIEVDEDSNSISRTSYSHSCGEIWHLSSSPFDKSLIATCYNEIDIANAKQRFRCALWRLPETSPSRQGSPPKAAEDIQSTSVFPQLELLCHIDPEENSGDTVGLLWEPTASQKKVVSLQESRLMLWDLDGTSAAKHSSSITIEGKSHTKIVSGKWSPHHSSNVVGICTETAVRGFDLRAGKQSYLIDNPHGYMVRQIDFNQNKPYDLVSCGDDCSAKIWDVRNPSTPLRVLSNHVHWVWCAKYNPFHDQLLLTSSGDAKVVLTSVSSVSSEPISQGVEEDEDLEVVNKENLPDGKLKTFEEHEDSVYALDWSAADPWTFASLSYDGRLVINRVPRNIKYKILQV